MKQYDRVTQVLSPFTGLDKVPPHVLQKACERGEKVHQYITAIVERMDVEIDEPYKGYIDSFYNWKDKKLFCQRPERFYCDKHLITGECDDVYLEDNKLVLVDYKTPLKESKTWMLQASAYSYLARVNGINIDRLEFVKLCKYGSPAQVFIYEENFDLFLAYLAVYRHCYKKAEDERTA